MPLELPPPIAAYVKANAQLDVDGMLQPFAADAVLRDNGAPELAVPKKIIKVTEIPVLGTGKTDYVAIMRMAEAEGRRAA